MGFNIIILDNAKLVQVYFLIVMNGCNVVTVRVERGAHAPVLGHKFASDSKPLSIASTNVNSDRNKQSPLDCLVDVNGSRWDKRR